MSFKSDKKVVIFFYYPIKPVKSCYEESLRNYMLDTVWAERMFADESVCVMNRNGFTQGQPLEVVRYQFGDMYNADCYEEEVEELVYAAFDRWVAINDDGKGGVFV